MPPCTVAPTCQVGRSRDIPDGPARTQAEQELRRLNLPVETLAEVQKLLSLLLYPQAGRVHTVLTLRSDQLRDHAGQISFPGGRRESGESLRRTALRGEKVGK